MSNEEFWSKVEETYLRAVQLPAEARELFLNETYPDRPDIRREVESLLQHQAAAERLNRTAIVVTAAEMFGDDETGIIGSLIGGKYRIREQLGAGGMAEVYLADHVALHMPFALKRPKPEWRHDPDYRQRFLEEARRAVILKHDNVARVHDVLDVGDDIFVVMEHIEGETLRERLDDLSRPISIDEFLSIALQCASALAAAHEKRMVHLDVKPANIMLTPAGQVKICDFGVARRLSPDSAATTSSLLNAQWVLAGTPAYMAPEVLLSNDFDERADLFSLGTVFYEILTGRNPFVADNTIGTTAKVVGEIPPPISSLRRGVDPKIERMVARLMAKEPTQRIASADDLIEELTAIRRSRRRFQDLARSVREALRESMWMKAAAAALLLFALAAPAALIYQDRLEQWVAGALMPENKILAVLPFQTADADPGGRHYATGAAEVLAARLAHLAIPDFQILPSREIRDRKIDSPEKAYAELDATLVLTGVLEFAGSHVRLSYELIRAADGRVLRAGAETLPSTDPFSLQEAIANDLMAMLKSELTPAKQTFGTSDAKAFFLYTSGVGALRDYHEPENIEAAINYLRQAVEQDDRYAAAHAALGQAYWRKFGMSNPLQPAWLDQAQAECERASDLDPRLAEAYTCLGLLSGEKGEHALALEMHQRAIDVSGDNDGALRALGWTLDELRRFDEAERALLKAAEVRPQYWANYSWIGSFYNRRRNYSKSIDHFQKALSLSPDNARIYYSLGAAYINTGQYENAISVLKKAVELRPNLAPAYSNLGVAYLRARRFSEAVGPLEKAASLLNDYRSPGNLARIYALTGQTDKARQYYDIAIRSGESLLQVNPRNHGVHLLVGSYYAMLGRKTEALGHIDLALGSFPDDPHYLVTAATAYLQLGDRNNALNLLERAVQRGLTAVQIREEPELDALAAEPRYIALVSNFQGR